MKKTILTVGVGIVAGAALVFLLQPGKTSPRPDMEEVAVAGAEPAVQEPTPDRSHEPKAAVHTERKAAVVTKAAVVQPVSAWAKLAEKYGPEKTALSAKITSNITSVINQGMDLANLWAKNSGSASVAEAATKEIMRNATRELALNDTQQQQASTVIQSLVGKRMNAVTDLVSAMQNEPEQLMDMLLAGDALARGQITQAQYDQMTLPTRTMLQNLAGFVMGQQPGATGINQLVGDEATATQLKAILTPEQQTKLTEIATTMNERIQARRARNNSGFSFQSGQIPVMQLDQLDQSVASVQKMTEAAKLMMEGMKGLKDANAQSATKQ